MLQTRPSVCVCVRECARMRTVSHTRLYHSLAHCFGVAPGARKRASLGAFGIWRPAFGVLVCVCVSVLECVGKTGAKTASSWWPGVRLTQTSGACARARACMCMAPVSSHRMTCIAVFTFVCAAAAAATSAKHASATRALMGSMRASRLFRIYLWDA